MQLTLGLPVDLPDDAYAYGTRTSGEVHGVVLTKPHVVELVLGLAGYTADRDLGDLALLEPACGRGAFLVPAVERLLESVRREERDVATLDAAISAYDIDENHVRASRNAVIKTLINGDVPPKRANALAARWIVQGDFLLAPQTRRYDAVVGNPPYVRIEQIADALQREYRSRFASIYDRADLYVAFIEHGLNLLAPDGVLSFICADRWTLNKYGGPLRRIIADRFAVRCYLDLHQASPFESEVIAYPAIFAIGTSHVDGVHVASLATASRAECVDIACALDSTKSTSPEGAAISTYCSWFDGDEPWVLTSPEHLSALRSLEARFAPLDGNGRTRVGIGVATGNDSVFVVPNNTDIEQDRLVPLVMRDDIERGKVKDAGRCVINAFQDDGRVVNLNEYPRLARYLDTHSDAVRRRHVSRKNPRSWFRTIDRVYPDLVSKPKLLIPDIAGSNEVVFESGHFHPHHNLYFVVSDEWDLELLGGLLSSRVALFFVWSYAVKMRGDYLRFQAQYLRRIRLPDRHAIPARLARDIVTAFRQRDFPKLDDLALAAFGLSTLPKFAFVDTRT